MAFKIYTKTGDKGETSLFGARVPKSHIRVESYGTIDELNSYMGLLSDLLSSNSHLSEKSLHFIHILKEIQDRLFTIGSVLASDPQKNMMTPDLLESDITLLEKEIDAMESDLPPLKNFILPGGHSTVSFCNIARTVCRRAERLVIALDLIEREEGRMIQPLIVQYLNRLSDYLFVLGRKIAQDLGAEEIIWTPRRK